MQTREPRKRISWIFVIILIITIPIIIWTVFMMNTMPTGRNNTSSYESTTGNNTPDSLSHDTTEIAEDSLLKTMQDR